MPVLDQLDHWPSMDPGSMRLLLELFPDHLKEAAQKGCSVSLTPPVDTRVLIVTGLGGSAISGDLVQSIAGPQLRIPLIVNRDYDLPKLVDASTLVIACSYSGNTEETLSAYQQARSAKAAIVCITSGGKLADLAKADANPVLSLPPGLPPRAALGHSLLTLLAAMQSMQFIPRMDDAVQETVELLSKLRNLYGVENPEAHNPAKSLARSLNGKIVVIYGSSGIMGAAAYRWRSQIAENAKNLSFQTTFLLLHC